MKWNKVTNRNDMPFDRKFLALWKGAICLASYDEELNQFWLCLDPDCGVMLIAHERENKFTHWAELQKPDDY